ncbi:MAG TPA: hypothetical protein VLH58_10485, partial [Candidatus Methylomirabilis sp.]|nr:hypothetical protein [Candidatus Methylomirabilis sp.]
MPTAPDTDHLRDDFIARLLKQYESRSDTLAKVVNGLVLFGFLFFFLILFPFVSLHHQSQRVTAELQELPAQARALDSSLSAYRAAAEGIQALKQAIEKGPFELRDAIQNGFADVGGREVRQSANQMAAQQVQQAQAPIDRAGEPMCPGERETLEWMNCQVRRQVERQFIAYGDLLEASVIAPVQRRPAEGGRATPPLADSAALRQGLTRLQVAFQERLTKTPEFWKHFSGKVDFYALLGDEVDRFWSESRLAEHQKELDRLLHQVLKRQADYQANLKKLSAREEQLAGRLEKMDSPFGKLPLGVLEGVHLFPILLTIGFVICTVLLTELARLRAALEGAYRERDPDGTVLTPGNVALLAPLWVEPLGPAPQRRLRTLVLLVPMVLALVSIGLVVYNWSISGGAVEVSELEQWVYGTLYLACALAG